MANITVRQLPTADALSAADTLLIAQADGTTRSVPLNRLMSEGMLASDSSGQNTMVTRLKIWVGAKSMTDIYGVNRPATDEYNDKAWQLIYPGKGNSPEDLFKTDLCHFTSLSQPVPMFVLNRPFVSLHDAIVWARYNCPTGWDLQFDLCGSTHCFHGADKLGQLTPNFLGGFNVNELSFTTRHRFVGSYDSASDSWVNGKVRDTDAYNWQMWIPDASVGQSGLTPGPHTGVMNRGTYQIQAHPDRRMGGTQLCTAVDDVYVQLSSHSGLFFWFRDIPRIYVSGITWASYAYGPRLNNMRFFRVSNGRMHMLGEGLMNLEAVNYVIANQRGCSFITKHTSSTILEVTEGGSAYIMCNLRHYSCGTTKSYYDVIQRYAAHDGSDTAITNSYSPQDIGLSYAAFKAAPQQIVKIAEVGGNGTAVSGGSTVVFDPLYHGWTRNLGCLTVDSKTLVYHDGTTLASGGATTRAQTNDFFAKFVNWGSFQNFEWLTGAHENIHNSSWAHYDADSLNWYYRGVTPQHTAAESGYTSYSKEVLKWNVANAASEVPWQAWKVASVTNGGSYAESIPGIVKGPYVMNNNDSNNYATVGSLSAIQGVDFKGEYYITQGNNTYGFFDGRGYMHYTKDLVENDSIDSLDIYGNTDTSGGLLQHFPTGKTNRIGAVINSPCSSGYSFGSSDAKIYLARQYNCLLYVPHNFYGGLVTNNTGPQTTGIHNVLEAQYGGGITKASWHSNNGFTVLAGNKYPVPGTTASTSTAFKYQNNYASMDHSKLTGDIVRNYPLIGGEDYVQFSDYPGQMKDFQEGSAGIGVGRLFLHHLPMIGTAESIPNQGTWNFPQYSLSHQNFKPDQNAAGKGHSHLFPLDTFEVGEAQVEDQIIMYFFDTEARPAIHGLIDGINGMNEPYFWTENTAFYWNQGNANTAEAQGDANIYGEGG